MVSFLSLILTSLIFIIGDALYLGVLRGNEMKKYFEQINGEIGIIANSRQFYLSALGVWLLLAFGVEYFVLPNSTSKKDAFINGALMGLLVYGVYDLTNLATILKWTPTFALQDVIWGTFLTATISFLRK